MMQIAHFLHLGKKSQVIERNLPYLLGKWNFLKLINDHGRGRITVCKSPTKTRIYLLIEVLFNFYGITIEKTLVYAL